MGQAKQRGTFEERKAAAILEQKTEASVTTRIRARVGKSRLAPTILAALTAFGMSTYKGKEK